MNAPTTHLNYTNMLREAGYTALSSSPPYKMMAQATTYDASAPWSEFTRARSLSFRKLTSKSKMCLEDDGRVVPESLMRSPARAADGGMLGSCVTLERLLGDALAAQYLRSQRQFFTEVCETFNGKGSLRKDLTKTCGNDAMLGYDVPEDADQYDGPADHPPLCGGILALAEVPPSAQTAIAAAATTEAATTEAATTEAATTEGATTEAAAPECDRRRLQSAAPPSEELWFSEWRRRLECWWLESSRREELSACLGALSLHLGSRFERLTGSSAAEVNRPFPNPCPPP